MVDVFPTAEDPLGRRAVTQEDIRRADEQATRERIRIHEECNQRIAAMEVRLAQSKSVHAGLLAKEMNRSAKRLALLRELWDELCEAHDTRKVPISAHLHEKIEDELE